MIEWPWEKSERALSSRIEEETSRAEHKLEERLGEMSAGVSQEVSVLNNQVMQAVSSLHNKVKLSDKEMTDRMDHITSNFKILHKAVGDSHQAAGTVIQVLQDRIKALEEKSLTNDFFESRVPTCKGCGGRIVEVASRCFSKYHLLFIVSCIFVMTLGALSLLIINSM